MFARPIVSVCCVIALAGGCALPGSGPAVPAAGNQFDGTYQGDSRLVRGFGFLCGAPSDPEAITIHNGRFDYPYSDSLATPAPVPVRIMADGTFSGQIQYGTEAPYRRGGMLIVWVTVAGKINGTAFDATEVDYRCTRRLELQRR